MKWAIHMTTFWATLTAMLSIWNPALAFDSAQSWPSPERSFDPVREGSGADSPASSRSTSPRYWEPPPEFQNEPPQMMHDPSRYNRATRYSDYPSSSARDSMATEGFPGASDRPLDATRPMPSTSYWNDQPRHDLEPEFRREPRYAPRSSSPDPRFDYDDSAPEPPSRSQWLNGQENRSRYPEETPRPNTYLRDPSGSPRYDDRATWPTYQSSRPATRPFDAERPTYPTRDDHSRARSPYANEETDHPPRQPSVPFNRYNPNRHEYPTDDRYATRPDYSPDHPTALPDESVPSGRTYGQPINPWR